MNTDAVMKKSITGAKWTFFVSIVSLPMGYSVNIILGRLSAQALGIYGLLNVFISFVLSFILFGGDNAIARYLPLTHPSKRSSFLVGYALISITIALLVMALILLYPQILELLLGQDLSVSRLRYFLILIPVIVLFSICNYGLNALMEISTSAILSKIVTFGNFIVFLVLSLFMKYLFHEHTLIIIWGASLAFYCISALLALLLLQNKVRTTGMDNTSSNRFSPHCPKGFLGFSLLVHASTIIHFAGSKMDQLLVLHRLSVSDLGLYYAVLQTATLVRFIPMLIGRVLLPTFSNLSTSNDMELIRKTYREAVKYSTFLTVVPALFCIFFSKEILGLFGADYVENHFVLALLSALFGLRAVGTANNSLIIAEGRAGIYLLGTSINTGLALAIMFLLVDSLGVLGLAIGRGVAVASWQLISTIIVTRLLRVGVKIPKCYMFGVAILLGALVLYSLVPVQNTLNCTLLFLVCLALFVYFAGYSKRELSFVFKQLLHK